MDRICDFCGARDDTGGADGLDEAAASLQALAWTTAVENGRTRHYCPTCTRTHLRSMEGKLDSQYW